MAYDKFWDEIVSERTLMKGYFRQGHAEGLVEGEKKGRVEGRAEGRAEGEHNKALDIARNLKSFGMPISQIITMTGLYEEDIKALQLTLLQKDHLGNNREAMDASGNVVKTTN